MPRGVAGGGGNEKDPEDPHPVPLMTGRIVNLLQLQAAVFAQPETWEGPEPSCGSLLPDTILGICPEGGVPLRPLTHAYLVAFLAASHLALHHTMWMPGNRMWTRCLCSCGWISLLLSRRCAELVQSMSSPKAALLHPG